jgi:hypothetical protein
MLDCLILAAVIIVLLLVAYNDSMEENAVGQCDSLALLYAQDRAKAQWSANPSAEEKDLTDEPVDPWGKHMRLVLIDRPYAVFAMVSSAGLDGKWRTPDDLSWWHSKPREDYLLLSREPISDDVRESIDVAREVIRKYLLRKLESELISASTKPYKKP